MKKKKLLFIFLLICIIVFLFFYYIFHFLGNNKNINQEEVVEDILNSFNDYEANVIVKVISNKNENTYEMYQVVNNDFSCTDIYAPENIKGLNIEFKDNSLKIKNSNLNMEKIYSQYNAILNNSLFLNTFANDYKKYNGAVKQNENEIIFEVKIDDNSNTYAKYKELHLDITTMIPNELIIKDNTKKTRISIIYNDIKIK